MCRGLEVEFDLEAAQAAIDAANSGDPNLITREGETFPRALAQGRMAAAWVTRLDPASPVDVALAARAHHLRRWEIARSDYPEGRAGYHRWKRDVRELSRRAVNEALAPVGVAHDVIARIGAMAAREGLGTDPGTQTVEDAACLVFLQTQFDELIERLGEDHVEVAVRKTLKKMSPAAIALAGEAVGTTRGAELLAHIAATPRPHG